jgi:hypothetical protein
MFDFPARLKTPGPTLGATEEECSKRKSSAKVSLAGPVFPFSISERMAVPTETNGADKMFFLFRTAAAFLGFED